MNDQTTSFFKNRQSLIYIPLFIAVYFSIFHFIAKPTILIFDEGSYSNNAIEMTKNNNFFVLHYDGKPTLYNTKPPFVIWMQSIFMRIFGMNELAVRLPSALSALIVIISLLFFSNRVLKKQVIGIFAIITLISTMGYVKTHVVRSGDLDAILVMWVTLYSLVYLAILLKNVSVSKYILFTCIGVVFAFLSKSVAGLIPILGLFIATIFSKERKNIFTNKYLYIGSISVVIVCIGYYLLRDHYAAGYLSKVLFSEYTRIYDNIMPWQTQPPLFYWKILVSLNHFTPFVFFLPAAIVLGIFSNEKLIRRTTLYIVIWCISYFLVISYPPNKLEWYDAPLYPFFSLLIGIFIYECFKNLKRLLISNRSRIAIQVLSCALLFVYPYYRVVAQNFVKHKEIHEFEREGFYIKLLTKKHPEIINYTILMQTAHVHHTDVAKFYMKSANYEKGKKINLVQQQSEIGSGDTILTCQKQQQDSIKMMYNFSVVHELDGCELIYLDKRK